MFTNMNMKKSTNKLSASDYVKNLFVRHSLDSHQLQHKKSAHRAAHRNSPDTEFLTDIERLASFADG